MMNLRQVINFILILINIWNIYTCSSRLYHQIVGDILYLFMIPNWLLVLSICFSVWSIVAVFIYKPKSKVEVPENILDHNYQPPRGFFLVLQYSSSNYNCSSCLTTLFSLVPLYFNTSKCQILNPYFLLSLLLISI